jgi:hypothetical protein
MRFLFSLVLLTGLAAVSQGSLDKPKPNKPTVPVLKADAVDSLAFKQVTSASPELGYRIAKPAASLEGGLRYMLSDRPILAMAESKGWFFYATSVVTDQKSGKPVHFLSGYAIKRDSRHVVGFGVW